MGFKHPPDLLAFLSTEVPSLPFCYFSDSKKNQFSLELKNDSKHDSIISRLRNFTLRYLNPNSFYLRSNYYTNNHYHHHHQSSSSSTNNLVNGLLPTPNRTVSLGLSSSTIHDICPGKHVLVDFCLPINTEGMLPRLWETKQRLTELNTSVDPLCLDWFRSILYTLMPHSTAKWIESNYSPTAKASVTLTGVEVVSPFGRLRKTNRNNKLHESSTTTTTTNDHSYLMPKTRRMAYMSLLANKSAEARMLRQRLRKRGVSIYPPRLGTSFRALAKHLVNANAGIIYIAGSPIIRIDTWMPSPKEQSNQYDKDQTSLGSNKFQNWQMCRDLSATFTTYAGQLSVTFSASCGKNISPHLDLILESMRSQVCCLNKKTRIKYLDKWIF